MPPAPNRFRWTELVRVGWQARRHRYVVGIVGALNLRRNAEGTPAVTRPEPGRPNGGLRGSRSAVSGDGDDPIESDADWESLKRVKRVVLEPRLARPFRDLNETKPRSSR